MPKPDRAECDPSGELYRVARQLPLRALEDFTSTRGPVAPDFCDRARAAIAKPPLM